MSLGKYLAVGAVGLAGLAGTGSAKADNIGGEIGSYVLDNRVVLDDAIEYRVPFALESQDHGLLDLLGSPFVRFGIGIPLMLAIGYLDSRKSRS